MALDIYTFGSGSYVVEALQSIKMFMGSDSYTSLARIAGLLGLLWVMLAALRGRGNGGTIQADWSWLLFYGFFWLGLVVPKVDLIVNDPINPPTSASPVVTGVPLGIGALAYITSGIGKGLVDKYETYITIPGDQKYSQNGMLFGSTMIQSLGEMQFPDARYSSDMNLFIGQCAFPMIVGGTLPIDAIATSTDLWQTISSVAPKNRWIQFSDNVTRSCYDAMTDLNGRMNAQVNTAAGMAGQKLWPTRNLSAAQAAFLSSAGGTTPTDFIGMTATGADVTRQAMMAGAVSQALEGQSIDTNNQAMAQAVFAAKGEQQQRNTYLTMGSIAARTLPVMKAVMEAISYAIAPVIFLFVLMPGGLTAFGQYALFMVWLQMWPILYAIINSIMYWYGSQASHNASLLSDGTHGLALDTLNALSSTNADMVALAGYMALSIPMVSYMLIRGGMAAGSSVYSSLMQPASGAATAAATEMTGGNLSMGNLSMDSASWYQMSANKMDTSSSMAWGMSSRTNPMNAATTTSTLSGGAITQMMSSTYSYGTQMNDAIKSSIGRSASESVTAARNDSVEYMASSASMLSDMRSFNHQVQNSKGMSDATTQQQSTQLSQALDKMESTARDFSSSHGLSYGTGLGLLSSVAKGLPLSGNADAKSQENYQEAVKVAGQSGFKEAMQTATQLSSQLSATHQEGVSDAAAHALQAGLQQNNALAQKAAASYQKASAFEAVRSRMEEHGISFSGDISNLMMQRLGISQTEFTNTQYDAQQGSNRGAAIQKLQGWVDAFVAKGGAAELVGLQDAPTAAGVGTANAANRADVTAQGSAMVQGMLHGSGELVGKASGNAGVDANSTSPAGYQALRGATQAGMADAQGTIHTGKASLQGEHDDKAALIGDMANRSASDAGFERTSDNVLAAVPEPVGDALKFANKGLVDIAATASGLSQGVAGAVERAATGREQDWGTDYGAGFNRVASSPMLTASEHGSTQQIYKELYGNGSMAQTGNPAGGSPAHVGGNVTRYDHLIQEAAARNNLDPDIIRAMMKQESEGDPNATSNKGAGGLLQLMPETAEGVAKQLGMGNYDRYDPHDNIMMGAAYMKQQMDKYDGNISLALAAYNAGPGAVDKYNGIPPYTETQNYVSRITATYQKLKG